MSVAGNIRIIRFASHARVWIRVGLYIYLYNLFSGGDVDTAWKLLTYLCVEQAMHLYEVNNHLAVKALNIMDGRC